MKAQGKRELGISLGLSTTMFSLRRSTVWPVVGVCALLLGIMPANGQAAPVRNEEPRLGSIRGILTTAEDDAASGLAGLTLKLSQGTPGNSVLTADTDDTGHFEFKNLRPGSYAISLSQTGFKAFTKTVNVESGQTVELAITLELETVAERVEVSEDTQAIS